MTQPVQEPSNERDIGGLAWRTAQLARRPPPFSGTPWPWIYMEAGGQTLPGDGAYDPFLFDSLYWDPNLVSLNPADVTDGSDNVFDIQVQNFGGTDYFEATLRLSADPPTEGWYWFEIWADIGDTGDGAAGVFWEVDMQQSAVSGGFFPPFQAGTTWAHIWNGTEYFEDVMRHDFKVWASAQRAVSMQSRQNTGVDKDLGGAMMIHYLGNLGGSSDSADWEFASP